MHLFHIRRTQQALNTLTLRTPIIDTFLRVNSLVLRGTQILPMLKTQNLLTIAHLTVKKFALTKVLMASGT